MTDQFVQVSVEIFPDRVEQLTNTPDGPVGRYVKFVSELLLNAARPRIGDRYSGQHPGPRLKDTGEVRTIGGSSFAVVFNHPIAFLHHEGTQAKNYPIGQKGQKLSNRFTPSRSSGGKFFGIGPVTHPGSNANPYLRDAAVQLGLRGSGTLLRGKRPVQLFRLRPI